MWHYTNEIQSKHGEIFEVLKERVLQISKRKVSTTSATENAMLLQPGLRAGFVHHTLDIRLVL